MDKKAMVNALIGHFTDGNKAQFAKMLGVSPQTISAWLARNTFDSELIYAKCRYLSANWLLTGEGEMLQTNTSNTHEAPCPGEKERKIANVLLGSKNYRREVWRASHSYLPAPWRAHSLPISPSWSTNASTISYQTSRVPTSLSG